MSQQPEPVMGIEKWIGLTCHPSTRAETVRVIQVLVRRSASAQLQITYRVEGDISRICVFPPDESRIATELWRHTCFEVFIAMAGQPAYHEFNFALSGEWTVYAFRDYRDGGPLADERMRPQIARRSTSDRLELDTVVRLDALSAMHPSASLRIGLSVIVEAPEGLSYWALRHRAGKPDFHHADGFALLLERPKG
jgi:hypothetical protein